MRRQSVPMTHIEQLADLFGLWDDRSQLAVAHSILGWAYVESIDVLVFGRHIVDEWVVRKK